MSKTDYESRLGTSRSDDIKAFVPEDAEPLFGDGDPSDPYVSPIFITDDYAYNTGVHCRRCYCDVAVSNRETGVVSCPNCGWSSADDDEQSWEDRAAELRDQGGLPEKRAKVIALVEEGRTHAEVQDELGLSARGEVGTHVARYRKEDRPESQWLAAHGPEI